MHFFHTLIYHFHCSQHWREHGFQWSIREQNVRGETVEKVVAMERAVKDGNFEPIVRRGVVVDKFLAEGENHGINSLFIEAIFARERGIDIILHV